MLKQYIKLCLILTLVQPAVVSAQRVYNTNNGSVIFRSDAPLELISAKSVEMRGKLDIDKKVFAFSININSFSGFNSLLQREHFNENYLESDKYPTASFSGKIIEDIDFSTDGIFTLRAKGNLAIHGVVQERIIKSDLIIKKGVISIKSNFTLLLEDHNIAIPKIVHEKLASEIKVEVKADMTL